MSVVIRENEDPAMFKQAMIIIVWFSIIRPCLAGDLRTMFPGALEVVQSHPIIINDARFIAIAQTDWHAAEALDLASYLPRSSEIMLQLEITNVAKVPKTFPMSGNIGVRLSKRGIPLRPIMTRAYVAPISPVTLNSTSSYVICRRGELRESGKANLCEFIFHDGTGSSLRFESLEPGDYHLHFLYSADASRAPEMSDRDASWWSGTALSKEIRFRIHAKPTKGHLLPERQLPLGREPRKLVESRPVKKNDAQLVVACDTNWRFTHDPAPIDIQLRLSNLTDAPLGFRRFDSFRLDILDDKGQSMSLGATRDNTKYLPPIRLSGGSSFSSCHRAELHSDPKNGNRLIYWDGTGSEWAFGPFVSGVYRLQCAYSCPPDPKYPNEEGGTLWNGHITSDPVTVNVLK